MSVRIDSLRGLAFVQDGGRPGRMHQGVPPGGPLVRCAMERANQAVGNPPEAALIERFGAIGLRAERMSILADDEGNVFRLSPGERLELDWDTTRRARYLSVRGGIDVPVLLGGRGTLVTARLGGLEGRALRRGDVLPVSPFADGIRLMGGPDLEAFAPHSLEVLTSAPFRISTRSDRTGTRLEGARIAWRIDAPPSRTTPMIQGAVELPPSGEPIVLGPDHPTTGGYPMVALIHPLDLDLFHRTPLGGDVRFARSG